MKSIPDRFWPKVDKNGPVPIARPDLGPCWLWISWRDADGYGQFRADGRVRGAHVVSYELAHGPIQPGLEPDHLCRVRHCVNDGHLEPVTHLENMRRGNFSGNGARQRSKTHCPLGHSYAGENLYVHPDGRRDCRTCRREADRRYRAKRRAA